MVLRKHEAGYSSIILSGSSLSSSTTTISPIWTPQYARCLQELDKKPFKALVYITLGYLLYCNVLPTIYTEVWRLKASLLYALIKVAQGHSGEHSEVLLEPQHCNVRQEEGQLKVSPNHLVRPQLRRKKMTVKECRSPRATLTIQQETSPCL